MKFRNFFISLVACGFSVVACGEQSDLGLRYGTSLLETEARDASNTTPNSSTEAEKFTAQLDEVESEFLKLLNAYRSEKGLTALKASAKLNVAAHWQSKDMALKKYFSHNDSLGRNPFKRMAAFLYPGNTAMAENIAAGNSDASATFLQWKNSPGHNRNMLGAPYRVIGIARYYQPNSPYRWYWTTDFGGRVDVEPASSGESASE